MVRKGRSVLEKKNGILCCVHFVEKKNRIQSVPVLVAVCELGIYLCRWKIEWCAAAETYQSGVGLSEESKKVHRHQLEKSGPHKGQIQSLGDWIVSFSRILPSESVCCFSEYEQRQCSRKAKERRNLLW